jgi:hypothetical protein
VDAGCRCSSKGDGCRHHGRGDGDHDATVVDTIAQSAMRVPDRFIGRIGVFSSVAASSINEGAAKTLRFLSLTQTDFTPVKAVAQVVLTDETIAALGDEGLRILGTELKNSVATGSDSAFLAGLSGNSGEAQGTDDWAGINADLEELLRDLALGAGSRPFLIMTPAAAKSLAVKGLVNGIDSLAWNGGSYAGVEILVSDAQTSGRITAVDATGLVVLLGDIELRSSGQALIEMVDSSSQTSVTGTGANMVSMFQTNSKALLAERSIAVKAIRGTAWAHLTGVQVGVGFDSPMVG